MSGLQNINSELFFKRHNSEKKTVKTAKYNLAIIFKKNLNSEEKKNPATYLAFCRFVFVVVVSWNSNKKSRKTFLLRNVNSFRVKISHNSENIHNFFLISLNCKTKHHNYIFNLFIQCQKKKKMAASLFRKRSGRKHVILDAAELILVIYCDDPLMHILDMPVKLNESVLIKKSLSAHLLMN